jgi:hypothetical protein
VQFPDIVRSYNCFGVGIGVTTTIAVSYANGINPVTGRALNTNSIDNMSYHAKQRAVERNISQSDINDALKNPLKITSVKYDTQGFPSVQYIGNNATVVVNPETGHIITLWPTSSQILQNILKTNK